MDFQFVKDEGKETKDDKFPVSRLLLLELCDASNVVLTGFNMLLTKTMFLCAWAFSMRISEFSETKMSPVGSQKSYNLHAEVITADPDGLSACFELDKMSLYHKSPRHRTIPWHKLPDFCRSTVQAFIYARPPGMQFYFCTFDRQQLRRNDVLDILDVCLMHSSYRFLHVMPHSFHQGRMSQEMLEGEDVTSVLVSCCWLLRSNAYEAYARSDLINKEPSAVFNAYPKYRREMSAARVKYLSHNWVHRPGPVETHPHDEILRKFYPDERMTIGPFIPISYPYPSAKAKMHTWIKFRKSGIYIRKQIAEQEKIAKEKYRRKKVSQAVHRTSWQCRYATNFDKHNFVRIKKLPAEGQPKKRTVETQITVEAKEQGIQTAYEPFRNPPTILINDSAFPVHRDALDMIPDNSMFSLSHVNNRHILCIANKRDHWQQKALSAKLSMMRTIK